MIMIYTQFWFYKILEAPASCHVNGTVWQVAVKKMPFCARRPSMWPPSTDGFHKPEVPWTLVTFWLYEVPLPYKKWWKTETRNQLDESCCNCFSLVDLLSYLRASVLVWGSSTTLHVAVKSWILDSSIRSYYPVPMPEVTLRNSWSQ